MSEEFSLSMQYYLLKSSFSLLSFLFFFITILPSLLLFLDISKRFYSQKISTSYLCDFDANLLHNDLNFNREIQTAQQHHVKWFIIPASNLKESMKLQEIKENSLSESILSVTSGLQPYLTNTIQINDDNITQLTHLIHSNHCGAVVFINSSCYFYYINISRENVG